VRGSVENLLQSIHKAYSIIYAVKHCNFEKGNDMKLLDLGLEFTLVAEWERAENLVSCHMFPISFFAGQTQENGESSDCRVEGERYHKNQLTKFDATWT
jgi:hypothetical protein